MIAGGDEKKEAVPAEKSESGPDSGTDDKSAGKKARGEDGKFKPKEGEASKEDKSTEGEDGPQKRINKAVKAQREAERKAEQLAKEIEELRRGKTSEEPKKDDKQKAEPTGKKPKAEDFQSYDEYIEALATHIADEREAKREKKEAEKREAEGKKQAATAWEKKKEAAREKHPDLDEVLEDAGETPISRTMHNIIAESDIGPELAYYLATHPDHAAEIKAMTPYAATRAMGRIEDKLTAEPEKPAEDKKPKAEKKELPKPPRNVGGSATPKEPKLDDPDTDFGTFKRIAKAHLNRER